MSPVFKKNYQVTSIFVSQEKVKYWSLHIFKSQNLTLLSGFWCNFVHIGPHFYGTIRSLTSPSDFVGGGAEHPHPHFSNCFKYCT